MSRLANHTKMLNENVLILYISVVLDEQNVILFNIYRFGISQPLCWESNLKYYSCKMSCWNHYIDLIAKAFTSVKKCLNEKKTRAKHCHYK